MAEKTKTRLDVARDEARASAAKKVATLNKRAIGVLNDENPDLIAAVMAVLDAEDAMKGKREEKLADPTVVEKREIVKRFTLPSTPASSNSDHRFD